MLKVIAISQKVETSKELKTDLDIIDHKILDFIYKCGYFPVVIPNNTTLITELFNTIPIHGIILSDGAPPVDTLLSNATRAEIEKFLIELAISKNLPLLGICRGMMVLGKYFGEEIIKVDNHKGGTPHHIFDINNNVKLVNSYHEYGFNKLLSVELDLLYKTKDKIVECFVHKKHKIKGIMWNPERGATYSADDITLIKEFFQ